MTRCNSSMNQIIQQKYLKGLERYAVQTGELKQLPQSILFYSHDIIGRYLMCQIFLKKMSQT